MSFTDFFSLLLPFSGKDHIVLSNFSILVCFALGRADVKIQAEKIFLPHGEKIKQETKAENQYPVYYPLYEDTGKYLQEIGKRKLASRPTHVVSKQRKATFIKIIEVLDKGFNKKTLNRIKTESAKNYGRPYNKV